MDRPKRTRKPNTRYDPNIYVLASFPKRNKHTVIRKHQVVIDPVDEYNGVIKSSGFSQSVRIITEGSLAKCQEKSTQFRRRTGSEEVDLQPINQDENDKEISDDDLFTKNNSLYKRVVDYPSSTTDTHRIRKSKEPTLDFGVVNGYKNVCKKRKHLSYENDDDSENESIGASQYGKDRADSTSNDIYRDVSPLAPLIIDEQVNEHHLIQNSQIVQPIPDQSTTPIISIGQPVPAQSAALSFSVDHSVQATASTISIGQSASVQSAVPTSSIDQATGNPAFSGVAEGGEEGDDDIISTQAKPNKRKRKRISRPIQTKLNQSANNEIENLKKEFVLFKYSVENRVRSLEKTFRILKQRNILKERHDLVNTNDATLQPAQLEPEFVLGVDVSRFDYAFDEHTKFVRAILRQAGYASNPNQVLQDENMVLVIQNAIKKRDRRLEDKEYFEHIWQLVKKSVRQLKHDNKRNVSLKQLRAQLIDTSSSQSVATTHDIV